MPIPAGSFEMGSADGEFDERPVHRVTISRPFLLAATEVSNAQYERFDPGHKTLRGKRGLSREDDEAVLFVSWHDAAAFCQWLSEKEGKPYRLPTEAEWEYACRAGTTTAYHAGNELPAECSRSQVFSWDPKPVSLRVGQTAPNAWGLQDMHGNAEEWCLDTYGPYPAEPQTEPVGRAGGEMKVARGGSHNTEPVHLRSANRMGTLPEDRHWLIGFRVACGGMPASIPLPPAPAATWASDVKPAKSDWRPAADMERPWFATPRQFVLIPAGSNGPLYSQHNHCPSVTWCENGDLLAVWFSTRTERGREMTILASRLRAGAGAWDPASEFFKAPDRNMTGSSLFNDGQGTLYHFNGLEAGDGWGNLALALRTSVDNGLTWSPARLIQPEHQRRNQVISGTLRTATGALIQPCDAVWSGHGGTAIHVSTDGGRTWRDPGAGTPPPKFDAGLSGGTIAGIHAGVVELGTGRLMALGRGDSIRSQQAGGSGVGDRMPMSLSSDLGRTWAYAASPFPPISSGQRLVLARLREGPLLFCSFTDPSDSRQPKGLEVVDGTGKQNTGFGLFAALSEDDGRTWPYRRVVSEGVERRLHGGAWTREFVMDATHGEPRGYLCFTQTPDRLIHLLSSAVHYQFNLAWLKQGGVIAESETP